MDSHRGERGVISHREAIPTQPIAKVLILMSQTLPAVSTIVPEKALSHVARSLVAVGSASYTP